MYDKMHATLNEGPALRDVVGTKQAPWIFPWTSTWTWQEDGVRGRAPMVKEKEN